MGTTLVQKVECFVGGSGGSNVGKAGLAQSGFNHLATELQVIDDDDGEIFFAQSRYATVISMLSSISEISG